MANIFFTSDQHFGHANVIKYAKRPFASVEEMDETMIANWNTVVARGDSVYVLGDFSFHKIDRTRAIFDRLNGMKFLIRGNHDKNDQIHDLFIWSKDLFTLKVSDASADRGTQNIVLCHYAMRVWPKSHYGAYQLYGHSHGSLPDDPNARAIDVGVDAHAFTPISYDRVKEIMSKKTFVPIDHHGNAD